MPVGKKFICNTREIPDRRPKKTALKGGRYGIVMVLWQERRLSLCHMIGPKKKENYAAGESKAVRR